MTRKLAPGGFVYAAEMFDALELAETTLAGTLSARGYQPGECTDGWAPEVRAEVSALAKLRAVLDKADQDAPSDPSPKAHPIVLDTLQLYRRLADGLSDMVEEGRLEEIDAPDDYAWLANLLARIAAADPGEPESIEAIRSQFAD